MAQSFLQVYTTVAARLSELPTKDGNLIFVRDTKKIYLDTMGMRIGYDCIQTFLKDSDRLETLAPVEGFYFVQETGVMWNYKDGWHQISPDNLNQIIFGKTEQDFPPVGDARLLYVTDDASFRWDTATNSYIVVSNKTEWKSI